MRSKIIDESIKKYYEKDGNILILGDVFETLSKIKKESIDMVFADPPYFLSNDGISCQGGKMVSVNKGDWDKADSLEEKHEFNRKWIRECKRVLKPNGTIWISGTLHNIYSIGMALEQEGFKIMNNITWQKTNPPPNLSCKYFTHSTETVLWAKKEDGKHYYNYDLMKELNGGKQHKDVWSGSLTKPSEKTEGKHPTQKPLYLLEKIVLASTKGVACKKLNREYIGIDNNKKFINLSKKRLEKTNE